MTNSLPSIAAAATAIRRGDLSPVDLVDACLANIERCESRVAAWVLVDAAGARRLAEQRAAEARAGDLRGPLHGIPLAIKDIVDVAGWPTRCGSLLTPDRAAVRDATIVARLRAAGAILLGKTVTTQFASFDPPPTKNPWRLDRTPGGSSSGSAAAAALEMCLGAIGSQTGGSITRPATYCGVAGCKPTYGRVSLHGIFPLAFHLDHPGPITRYVSDLAVLLEVMAGHDPADPVSLDLPVPGYAALLDAGHRPRLGWLAGTLELASPDVAEVASRAIDRFAQAGAAIRSIELPEPVTRVHALHRRLMAAEAAHVHRRDFPARRDQFGPQIARLLDEGLALSRADYLEAVEHHQRYRASLAALLGEVDCLVMPATNTVAPAADTTGDPLFNSLWSYSGLPVVSIPVGLNPEGLPVGLQFIGPAAGEAALLAVAAWCEGIVPFEARPPLAV